MMSLYCETPNLRHQICNRDLHGKLSTFSLWVTTGKPLLREKNVSIRHGMGKSWRETVREGKIAKESHRMSDCFTCEVATCDPTFIAV